MKDINWDFGVAEVGYLIDEAYHNRGFASEALQKIVDIGFAHGLKKSKLQQLFKTLLHVEC